MNYSLNNKNNWKSQIAHHFGNFHLSPERSLELETLLRNTDLHITEGPTKASLFTLALQRLHQSGIGYAAAALAAAALTFAIVDTSTQGKDSIEELASVATKPYPPDFDLEGDATAFQAIMQELMPNETFTAEIPKQIQAKFAPAAGRFFTWGGESGVRINLVSNNSGTGLQNGAALYIVRLPKHAVKQFPLEKTTKKIKGIAGKDKSVKAWRDGRYGFALVQYVAINEGNPSVEEP